MNLPNNGSVVVVDDQFKEALPLIQALSNRSVPVMYFSGEPKSLPKEPILGVRLIFLDMRYSFANDDRNIVSNLMGILMSILHEENGPYILIVWSKHESEHLMEFQETLYADPIIPKPIIIMDFDKGEHFKQVKERDVDQVLEAFREISVTSNIAEIEVDKSVEILKKIIMDSYNDSVYQLVDNSLKKIEEKLIERLSEVGCLNAFFIWENIINKSSRQIINSVSNLSEIGEEWQKNMESLLYRMAEASAGAENLSTKESVLHNTFSALNELLPDNISSNVVQAVYNEGIELEITKPCNLFEKEIDSDEFVLQKSKKKYTISRDGSSFSSFETYANIESKQDENERKICRLMLDAHLAALGSINFKLLTLKSINNLAQSGNVYKIAVDNLSKKMIAESLFQKDRKDQPVEEVIDLNLLDYIELDITPECDYAQKKVEAHRVLPGLIVPCQLLHKIKSDGDYFFVTPIFKNDNNVYVVIFNFKHFTSKRLGYFDDKQSEFTLRMSIQTDIKNKLAAHMIRAGIIQLPH